MRHANYDQNNSLDRVLIKGNTVKLKFFSTNLLAIKSLYFYALLFIFDQLQYCIMDLFVNHQYHVLQMIHIFLYLIFRNNQPYNEVLWRQFLNK